MSEELKQVTDVTENETIKIDVDQETKKESESKESLESDTQPEETQQLPTIEESNEELPSSIEPEQTEVPSVDEEPEQTEVSSVNEEPEQTEVPSVNEESERVLESGTETEQTQPVPVVEEKVSDENAYTQFVDEIEPEPEGDFFQQDSPALVTRTEGEVPEEFELEQTVGLDDIQQEEGTEYLTDTEEQIVEDEEQNKELQDKEIIRVKIEDTKQTPQTDTKGISHLRRASLRSIMSTISIYKHGYSDYSHTPRADIDDLFTRFSLDVSEYNLALDESLVASLYSEEDDVRTIKFGAEEKAETKDQHEDISTLRAFLYEKHAEVLGQITQHRMINTLLQRRVSLYFKRKHMDYALQETDQHVDNIYKYNHLLDDYSSILKEKTDRSNLITSQLESIRDTKEKMKKQLDVVFTNLQNRERDVGLGLIYSKTGTEISDKLVQQLINRQKTGLMAVSSMRLKSLQIKYMVKEKEAAIQVLDEVDKDHHLNYYEKLKEENKMYSDKIEEKEVELAKLRLRCNETIQVLAHLREKISALDQDIDDLKTTQEQNIEYLNDMRRYVNNTKKERDLYRSLLLKLQEDSGLLKEKELLKDMENSINEAEELRNSLEQLKAGCASNIKKIRCIRKRIEERLDRSKPNYSYSGSKKSYAFTKISSYRDKPEVFMPILPESAMDHLIQDFQPTVRRININTIPS